MLIAAFASAGLPGMSGFIGEFLSLLGAFLSHRPYAIISAVGVILAALYLLWMFQRVFTGEPTGDNLTMKDLNAREILTLVPLLGLSVFLGVYPKPVLDRLEPSVKALIVHVEEHSDWCESDHKDAAGTCEPGDRFTSEASATGGEGG
jgi:NADH-quinone oxidoreductase subunit M